jgi:diaminopimelate decarboxylase
MNSDGATASPMDAGGRADEWRRRVEAAVRAAGTPCYVASWAPVSIALDRIRNLDSIVPVRPWLSFKTHPVPALAAEWIRRGGGVEVVSDAELVTVLQLGCPLDQLLVNGVAKHAWLGRHRLHNLRVHFDSPGEIGALLSVALDDDWRVGVRCHVPDERDARDLGFGGQFGMASDEAILSMRRLANAGVEIQSVHFHLGQRRHRPGAYSRAIAHVSALCDQAQVQPRIVDCGGSLPAPNDSACDAAIWDLQQAIQSAPGLFPQLEEIWLENGRYISTESTVLAVRVLDIKEREECRYVICDGGRTNHALAADHDRHRLVMLREREGATRLTTVCGPTCMTDDSLGRFDLSEDVGVGDVLIWCDAGAYHLPWETRFSHGLSAVVWFGADDRLSVVRHRENAEAWTSRWVAAEAPPQVSVRESI